MLIKRGTSEEPNPSSSPQQDAAILIGQLHDPSKSVRFKAVRGLSVLGAADDELLDHLADETAESVRSAILTILITRKSAHVAQRLLNFLSSADPALRNSVIEALQNMPDEVAPAVERLVRNPDSDVRIFAMQILGALVHPQAQDWLLQALRHDPHVNVCATAVDGLAEIGDDSCLPALSELPRRFPEVPFIGFAVDAAVRRIRGS